MHTFELKIYPEAHGRRGRSGSDVKTIFIKKFLNNCCEGAENPSQ